MDQSDGVVWRFLRTDVPATAVLQCDAALPAAPLYLSPDLRLVSDLTNAARWRLEAWPGFRADPGGSRRMPTSFVQREREMLTYC